MVADGIAGTYREATVRMGASKIGCDACGFFRELPAGGRDEFRLWYRTDHRGHALWARNDAHLEFLIEWLSGDMRQGGLGVADRAYVEALPAWMLTDRHAVVARLRQLKQRG